MDKHNLIKLTEEQEKQMHVRAGQEGIYLSLPWSLKTVLLREEVAIKLKANIESGLKTYKRIKEIIEEDLGRLAVIEQKGGNRREEIMRLGIVDVLMRDPLFNSDLNFWKNKYYETVVGKRQFIDETFEDSWNALVNIAWDLFSLQEYDWRVAMENEFEFTHDYSTETGVTTRSLCLKVPYNGVEILETELEIAMIYDYGFENTEITVCYREKRVAE
jgi:hypothetical protein